MYKKKPCSLAGWWAGAGAGGGVCCGVPYGAGVKLGFAVLGFGAPYCGLYVGVYCCGGGCCV